VRNKSIILLVSKYESENWFKISNNPVFGNVTAVSGGSAPAAIAILTVVARPTPPPGNTSPQVEMDFQQKI
jgi:D-tyrosyl-tRNA(Tyr) deacylase